MPHQTNSFGDTFKEVLGSLSIIAFLSSPSMAGYTTASAKNRANQILNGASVRAIVVSAQIQKGSETPTLGGFTDDAIGGATFENIVKNTAGTDDWNKATDKRFSLALTEIDEKVCTQMKASVDQNSIIRDITDDCTALTYNNDLSTTDLSPNDPEPSGPKGDECTDSCSGGATCENGYCECPSGSIWQPSDNSGNGECKEITEGDCKTNADCEEGKYCKITGTAEKNCAVPTTGSCTTLDSGIEATYKDKTFLCSSAPMSWWSARNWCLAHGKSLASLLDLGITGGYENSCSESACTGADWDALKAAFGSSYYWTNDSHSSCFAFVVNANLQRVGFGVRNGGYYALCR